MSEWDEITNTLKPVTWDEIKEFYKRNYNEIVQDDWKEAFCFAWSKSRNMVVIDYLATGYRAAQHQAKVDFAAKYDHKSPLQVIAAEYVKRRGTTGALALMEENRFIDGYEAGLHASKPQWISVKDRLPKLGVMVLVKIEKWGVDTDHNNDPIPRPFDFYSVMDLYEEERGKFTWDTRVITEMCPLKWDDVTHWMPLPTPPEEEK